LGDSQNSSRLTENDLTSQNDLTSENDLNQNNLTSQNDLTTENDLTQNDLTENDLTENELLSQLPSQLLSQKGPEIPSISKPYLNYYSTRVEILYKINNLLFFLITRYLIKFFYSDISEDIINE
jgi:hypothetical protein